MNYTFAIKPTCSCFVVSSHQYTFKKIVYSLRCNLAPFFGWLFSNEPTRAEKNKYQEPIQLT